MDLEQVPVHVRDIAQEFGYKSDYSHDGNGHIFKLTSDEKGKKPVEFGLDDQTAKVTDIIQLKFALKEKIEGGEKPAKEEKPEVHKPEKHSDQK